MTQYRCYLLDDAGRIFHREFVECEDPADAVAQAGTILADSGLAAGAEVWEGAYMVQRLKKVKA